MYVDPFLAGAATVVFVEVVAIFAMAIFKANKDEEDE